MPGLKVPVWRHLHHAKLCLSGHFSFEYDDVYDTDYMTTDWDQEKSMVLWCVCASRQCLEQELEGGELCHLCDQPPCPVSWLWQQACSQLWEAWEGAWHCGVSIAALSVPPALHPPLLLLPLVKVLICQLNRPQHTITQRLRKTASAVITFQ